MTIFVKSNKKTDLRHHLRRGERDSESCFVSVSSLTRGGRQRQVGGGDWSILSVLITGNLDLLAVAPSNKKKTILSDNDALEVIRSHSDKREGEFRLETLSQTLTSKARP